ncbi:MAG TPA: HAD family hydrolase [bacterium]|nr:HAD family hydrolase [bacterium]
MIKAVAFDLDGTITRPFLNFARIRLEIGVPMGRDSLLDKIAAMPAPERERASAILARYEEDAAKNAELNDGVIELMSYVSSRGLKSAVVTRNSEKSTQFVLDKLGLEFDRVITRDSGLPIKPDPAVLIALAKEWGILTREVLMVGDFRYDVDCGRAAGSPTCLVTNGRGAGNDCGADYEAKSPVEVIAVLRKLHETRDNC